jgi:T5SS/PEP-CTERM-associated repeat protein/autotransporter-associated beta strand protein
MSQFIFSLLIVAGLFSHPLAACAQVSINVNNASFETPDVTATAPYFQAFPNDDGASVGFWQSYGGFKAVVAAGHYGTTPAGLAGSQFGDQTGQAGTGIFQDAAPYDDSGDTNLYWQAGYTYTLTVAFFSRSDSPLAAGDQLDMKLYYRPARNGAIGLLGNTHVLGSQVNTTNVTDKTMTVTVQAGDPSVGQPIGIWFDSVAGAANSGDWGYDNVRLTRAVAAAPPVGGLILTNGDASPQLTLDPPNVTAALHFGNDNTVYSLQGVNFTNVSGRPNNSYFTVTGFVPGVEGDGFKAGVPSLGTGTDDDLALGNICNSFYFGSDTSGGFNFLISGLSPYSTNKIEFIHYIGNFGPRETVITIDNGGASLSQTNFEVNGKPINTQFSGIVADGSGSITGRFQGLTDGAWLNALVITFQGQGPIPVYTWSGAADNNWDINGAANWILAISGGPGSPSVWTNNVITRFDDSASSTTVNATTALAPVSLTISNETKNFTFTGSGGIAGPRLLKQGGGTLTVLSTNSFGTGANGNSEIQNGAVLFGGASSNRISGQLRVADLAGSSASLSATNNASVNLSDVLLLATDPDSSGELTLAGDSLLTELNGYCSIGLAGVGAATLQDDAVFNGGTGDFNVSDLANSQGTLNLQDHALVSVGSVYVGKSAGCIGTVNQTGGTVTSLNTEFQVGAHGQGTWNQSGGTNISTGYVSIGRYADGLGTYNISGDAVLAQTNATRNFLVGEEGNGFLNLSNNAVVSSASTNLGFVIGPNPTGVGYVTLAGGTLIANQISGGPGGSLFYFNGGTLKAGADAGTNFMHNLNIGAFTDAAYISAGGANIDSAGHTIRITTAFNEDPASPGGDLTKLGDGALLLDGFSFYTGATTVAGGTLGGSGGLSGAVTVNAEGKLSAGDGLANGTALTIGSATLNGTVVANISKDSGSPLADYLIVNAPLNYHGALNIVNVGGAPLQVGDTFTIFYASSFSGAFNSISTISSGQLVTWNMDTPSPGQITVASVMAAAPPALTNSFSGNTLTLNWPAANLGWILQVQTNSSSSGLGTNWVNVPGSDSANSATLTINPDAGSVFYRLVSP